MSKEEKINEIRFSYDFDAAGVVTGTAGCTKGRWPAKLPMNPKTFSGNVFIAKEQKVISEKSYEIVIEYTDENGEVKIEARKYAGGQKFTKVK